jgi:glycosyltransferase involved in cell wall biosynthesis
MLPTADPIRVGLDAHVIGRRKTGNETYVVNLGSALAARPDVDALAYVDAGARWPAGLRSPTIRELRLRAPQLRIPVELPFRATRDRVNLLHVQYVAPLARLPIVDAIHDISFEDVPGLFSRPTTLRLKWSVKLSAKRSAAIVTLSEFTRGRLLHHYGLDPDRVIVAPAGVNDRWRRLPPDEARHRLEGRDLPPRYVLAVGNLHPRKNIPRLIRSIDRLRRSTMDDLGLVVAGQPGWHADEVHEAIARVRGEAWVVLTGYVPDATLEAFYNEAAVVAYPSIYEGFGLPVAEALAIGAVVVASNTTSIPEVAGDAALLVEPEDDEALTAGLERALSDESLRLRLRAAGPERARQLTWESCAAATVEAYRLALGRPAPVRGRR